MVPIDKQRCNRPCKVSVFESRRLRHSFEWREMSEMRGFQVGFFTNATSRTLLRRFTGNGSSGYFNYPSLSPLNAACGP